MEVKFNDTIHRIYYLLKLNFFILLGNLLGGCFLSVLNASITSHREVKGNATLLTFKMWWQHFIVALKQTWWVSWAYNLVVLTLIWALFFTSQFKGVIFFASWLIQLTLLGLVLLALHAHAQLLQYMEGNQLAIAKLALIQVFMAPKVNIGTLFYGMILIAIGSQWPALVVFFASSFWIYLTTNLYYREWQRLEIL